MHAIQVVYVCQPLLELSQCSVVLTPAACVIKQHGRTSDSFHTSCIRTFSCMKRTFEDLLLLPTDKSKDCPSEKTERTFDAFQ